MIDNAIISRLENLKYLGKIKKANVSIISKKSEYHDLVKFYAQINKDNVIQKISYQATGCTTFMVMCSYFCELVEGKNISEALEINKDNFEIFTKLKTKDEHVFPIILNTFKLLVDKYNKGVQNGKIIPAETIVVKEVSSIKKEETKQPFIDNSIDKYLENTDNKPIKSSKKKEISKENTVEKTIEPIEEIIEIKEDEQPKATKKKKEIIVDEIKVEKPKKKSTKKIKKEVILPDIEEFKDEDNISSTEVKIEPIVVDENVVKVIEIEETHHVTTKEDSIVEIKTKKTNEIHLGHLSSLQEKLKTKEQHEKSSQNIQSLNSLLQRMDSHKEVKKEEVVEEKIEEPKEVKKEKKSFFSWFKRK